MFGIIVVGTDGSDTASIAVRHAGELAATTGSDLAIVTAYHPVPESRLQAERRQAPADVAWRVNPRREADAVLDAVRQQVPARVDVVVEAVSGEPSTVLLDAAERHRAGLLVIGNVGMTGARRFLLGSVPNRVSHHAPCSVLIVRTED